MHKNYFLEVINEKPALFAAMLRCNGMTPADGEKGPPQALPGLHADFPRARLEELWRHGPSRRHLRALMPGSAEPFWDFSEQSRCLALLEPETVNELVLFYGANLHAPEIARTILGKDLARLREALGARVYAYALQRGQYQMPVGRGVFSTRNREMPLAERVGLHGKEALGIVASSWPQPLQGRVDVTYPTDISVSEDVRRGIWFDMKKILLREVASAWKHCFT